MIESKNKHSKKMEMLYKNNLDADIIDLWAMYYLKDDIDKEISNQRYLNKYRIMRENNAWKKYFKPNDYILDCGCGRGFFMNRLMNLFSGNIHIIGADISLSILKKNKDENGKADLIQCDASELAFKESTFDAVLVIATFEHVQDTYKVITELNKVLKKNGIIYLTVHKNSIDPLVIPDLKGIVKKILRMIIFNKEKTQIKTDRYDKYTRDKSIVREEIHNYLYKNGFIMLERNGLISTFKWNFYKRFFPKRIIKLLIKMNSCINKLNFNWYKDLEYQIWKKIE